MSRDGTRPRMCRVHGTFRTAGYRFLVVTLHEVMSVWKITSKGNVPYKFNVARSDISVQY